MDYKSISLQENLKITNIVSIHYFEYMCDFSFPGEAHDFWEFLCVDKGEVVVMAHDHKITLKKGEVIFHKPNEFHSVKANGVNAPNLVVMSFYCNSPAMEFFEGKVLTIGETEKNLLASILSEFRNAFSSRLDDPYLEELQRREIHTFGSEQLIKIHMENFLIQLYRKHTSLMENHNISKSTKIKTDEEIYGRIVEYLNANLSSQMTIQQICKDNLIGRSQLQKIFREKNSCGIIDYFSQLRIRAAKQMIRDKHLNFTQIADTLGYTSIHYFSRQFKKITGMTPSEYASSIKVLSEPAETITHFNSSNHT